jgi:hypothetical protein
MAKGHEIGVCLLFSSDFSVSGHAGLGYFFTTMKCIYTAKNKFESTLIGAVIN